MERWQRNGTRNFMHYGEGREVPLSYDIVRDASDYEDFPNVTQPTLVLHGADDDVVPVRLSKEFVSLHPEAKLVVLDSGHELTDVMDQLWRHVSEFLGVAG